MLQCKCVYIRVPETKGCDGCIFDISANKCYARRILKDDSNFIKCNGFIWVLKETDTKEVKE